MREFPGFSRNGTHRWSPAQILKPYPSELVSCGRPHATFAYAHSNSLRSLLSVLSSDSPAVRRTERQQSLTLTPTHCVRCCPFCHANRLTALRAKRQRSLRSLLRLRLRCPACHANRLTALRAGWQRSLTLTPTHCVRCCPFCHANRLTALRAGWQRSLTSCALFLPHN